MCTPCVSIYRSWQRRYLQNSELRPNRDEVRNLTGEAAKVVVDPLSVVGLGLGAISLSAQSLERMFARFAGSSGDDRGTVAAANVV
jgi:hypothetical protein